MAFALKLTCQSGLRIKFSGPPLAKWERGGEIKDVRGNKKINILVNMQLILTFKKLYCALGHVSVPLRRKLVTILTPLHWGLMILNLWLFEDKQKSGNKYAHNNGTNICTALYGNTTLPNALLNLLYMVHNNNHAIHPHGFHQPHICSC